MGAKNGFLIVVLVLSITFGVIYLMEQRAGAIGCGGAESSCKSCHETQGQMPVSNMDQWHIDHATLDACDYCHAGKPFSQDEAKAHMGMVDPFSDLEFNCGSCHFTDWEQLAATYGAK